MPKSKVQKQSEAREKLLKEYQVTKARNGYPFDPRLIRLLGEIRNLNTKLGFTDYSLENQDD